MESQQGELLYCSDQEFDKRITDMDQQSLLETVAFLQKEMASEQTRFDDVTSRRGQITDPESPEYETLSAELMAVQANLATLMARNMKCFNQQTSVQNKELFADLSDDTSSLNGTGSEVELRNGDSVRLINGQQHKRQPQSYKKTSPRPHKSSRGRVVYDEGEPDVAGYEESFGAGDDNGNANILSLQIDGGGGTTYGRGRRDFHSPESQQQFIDFGLAGPIGESTTDDLVTVEKNKKNEENEARLDEREQLEQKAYRDFESLMRFEDDQAPAEITSGGSEPRASHKHPGRLFYIDNVTQGESYTDTDHRYKEIDVDRIGEEDEGEEDDPSEWKYAGDGDNNKIPDGPIVHNGATAKIYAESLVRRLQVDKDDVHEDVDVTRRDQGDVYDVKRSTVTMVLRNSNVGGGDAAAGDDVPDGSSAKPEVATIAADVTSVPRSPRVLRVAGSAGQGPDNGAAGDAGTAGYVEVESTHSEQTVALLEKDLTDAPKSTPGVEHPDTGDQNSSRGPDSSEPAGIPSTGVSSDTLLLAHTPSSSSSPHTSSHLEEQQEAVPVLSTSRVTLTLNPAPAPRAPEAAKPQSPVTPPGNAILHAARISLRSVATSHPVSAPEEVVAPQDGPEYSSSTPSVSKPGVSSAKVHFRSYASFAPSSEPAEDDEQEGEERRGADHVTTSGADDDDYCDSAHAQKDAGDMGNALQVAKEGREKEADAVSVKSAVTPACLPSEGFTADDKVKDRTTLKDWDPTNLMQELYKIQLVPEEEEDFFEHITMEGYMEKLPINKKKATLLKTWKRRYFKVQEGYLYYYEPPDTVRQKTDDGKDTDKPSGSIQLMGGNIETLDSRIIGVDDGRGRYLLVRAPTDSEYEDWCRALKSQTIENIKASWVKPVVHAIPSRRRNVIIIDIGSCSVRAGILGENPSLPSLFFPCIMATSRDTGDRVFGHEALLPEARANCTLSYPVRPSVKVDKFAVDMAAMPELFDKIFNDLKVDPSNYWIMFSAPGNFSDKIKQHFMDILVNRFHVVGVNIVAQTLLSLYSYNSRSGIVVDVGERLEIVPVTDGYIVEAGVTRQPYGGHRITEALNSSFTESKYRFFTDVEFQIVRLAMEKSCYVALEYNTESRRCQQNPRAFKKTIHLEQYGLPSGTWKNVTHTQSRFSSTEGLFNTELWGMDNPMMHKLIAKAVQVCPMDLRREIWRSIFLSGGVTLLPGFAERLQEELTKLAPPSVKVQVHASPQRYHSAYIGACALANLQEFEQACISSDEWRETGPPCLRKWHMY